MSFDYIQPFKQFVSLIVVLAPMDVIPLYLGMTHGLNAGQRRQTLQRMVATVLVTLVFFQYSGLYLFNLIGITLPSFQVAGGLILASMAWSMLHATPSRVQTRPEAQESQPFDDISIVPLGIPMLAGPGTITTVILYAQQQGGHIAGNAQLSLVIAFTALVLYGLFAIAVPLYNKLGVTGARVATRIMGMLLLALAIEFVLRGLNAGLHLHLSS